MVEVVEIESTSGTLAVNDCCLGPILGTDGHGPAGEVQVPVQSAGIDAVGDVNGIAVCSDIDSRLDGLLRPVFAVPFRREAIPGVIACVIVDVQLRCSYFAA